MKKHWGILATFTLAACSGHTVPSAGPASAELHEAPAFAPIAARGATAIAAAQEFVRTQATTLGLNGHTAFDLIKSEVTADGFDHVRLQQTYDGVKVWGSDIVVQNDGSNITAVNGNLLGSLANVDTTPSLADTTAATIAKTDYLRSAANASAVKYTRESSELVVLPSDGSAHLAWHVVFMTDGTAGPIGIWNYFIDAHDGAIVNRFNNLQTAVQQASGPGGITRLPKQWNMELDVDDGGGTTKYTMNTTRLETKNLSGKTSGGTDFTSTSLNFTDKEGNDAHGYGEVTLNMLKDWQGYNSIDNQGFKLISLAHYSTNYANAFWDGQEMNYGDGDGSQLGEMAGSLDVVAHEIDHGFTSFHSNLDYQAQSGGMNESFSDIAGTTAKFYYEAKTASFNLGGDIFLQPNTYIRWMCKPSTDNTMGGMSIDNASQYTSSLDVHYSSGVMNRAFCHAAKRLSGVDPSDDSTATGATPDGVKRASQAWYEANASKWTSSATFTQGCQGVVDAATALKFTAAEISALGDSWKDVGVTCNYTHVDDFMLTIAPATATTMAGVDATYTVTLAVPAGNMAQAVALTATGLPSGVTSTFNPASVTGAGTSTLTIHTAYDTTPGDIMFKVTGTAGMATHDAPATLTVTAPPPDLTPPPVADMATGTGGNGGSGGNGNHGGGSDSGCSMGGTGAGSSAGALFFVVAALLLAVRRRTRALALSRK